MGAGGSVGAALSVLAAFSVLAALGLATPASAQAAYDTPYWIHITPMVGAMAVSRPGDAGGPVATLQLEVSRALPVGIGMAGGYWFPSSDSAIEPDGLFGEILMVYRFHLRAGGAISPYAGPVLGAIRDDTGAIREVRGFFGGRGGVDIPLGIGWPALRLEASYRHLSEAAGRGAGDTALLLVGGRWSLPLTP